MIKESHALQFNNKEK